MDNFLLSSVFYLRTLLAWEARRSFTPSPCEIKWVVQQRLSYKSRLACLVMLKCFQMLGYFPKPIDVPTSILTTVREVADIPPNADTMRLVIPSSSAQRIKAEIRSYCGVKPFKPQTDSKWLIDFANKMAATKETTIDIINAMIELLVKECYELPGFSTLERIAADARSKINNEFFMQSMIR